MGIFSQNQAGQPKNNGELHNLQLTESVFGTCLPILIGTGRLHGKLIFYGGFKATPAPNSGGKGIFGGKATQFEYYADQISALCSGPTLGLMNIWDQNGKLQNLGGTYVYTVPSGGGSVNPTAAGGPPVQTDLGVSKAASYSVTANDYGSPGPVTLTGTQQVPMQAVSGTPGAGQYSFDPSTSTYTFSAADAGAQVTISYSCVFSLFYFQAVQGAEIPSSSPWQVSTDNEAYFNADEGVYFVDNGSAGIKVSGTPSATNQYKESSGVYTFFSGDAGRFVYIRYQYQSSDPNLTNSSKLNLTFVNGAQSQAPWSYMTSKYPSAAFGFSGVCYAGANPMALGESASMPSYNYEVVGRAVFGGGNLDALVADAMTLLLTGPLIGVNFPSAWMADWTSARAYHAANSFFISDKLDTQQPVAQAMQRWLDTGNIAAVWSGGQLKLIPYGDTTAVGNGYTYTPPTTPAVTLTWDDLQKWTDGKTGETTKDDPLQVSQKAPQDCLNYVQCQWTNRQNDYNNELTVEQNDAFIALYGVRPEASQTWDFITTQTAATWALNLRLKRNLYIRNGYKFRLSFRFSALEPMDLVVLPTGENVRILQIDDDEDGMLTVTAEQWSYGTANVTIYPKQVSSSYQPTLSQALPGDTSVAIFEATPLANNGQPNTIQIAMAGEQPAWGGCKIYISTDGTEFSLVDSIVSGNRVGLLSAALASNPDPDLTDTLSVDMSVSAAELVSVTAAQRDSFVSLCAIADASGSLELLSYETATLTGPDRYDLTSLRRGVYGTPIGAHSIGAEFTYLGSTGIYNYQYPPQYAGQTVFFKFASFNLAGNQVQDLSQVPAVPFTIPGTSLQNPSLGNYTTVPANPLTAQSGSTSTSGQITVAPFTASLNNQSVSCLAAGAYAITGLNTGQRYYVYYVDFGFQGGAIIPVATQNQADYLNKSGYYFLGSIVTPPASGAAVYKPTAYSDVGSYSTLNPTSAYDSDPNSYALVKADAVTAVEFSGAGGTSASATKMGGGTNTATGAASGGLPSYAATSAMLYIPVSITTSFFQGGGSGQLQYSLDGGTTWKTCFTSSSATTQTVQVPISGFTNLSSIQVRPFATVTVGPGGNATLSCSIGSWYVTVAGGSGSGGTVSSTNYGGDCSWYSFLTVTPAGVSLYVSAAAQVSGPSSSTMTLRYSFDGGSTWTNFFSSSTAIAQTLYSIAVPGGTSLNMIHVEAIAAATTPGSPGEQIGEVLVYDIYVQ